MTVWKYLKCYFYLRRRKRGRQTADFKKGVGYYITVGVWGCDPRGRIDKWKMQSGKTAIVKLVDFELFSDPHDMVKQSWWMFLGYEGQKLINDCDLTEYIKIYHSR